MSDVATVPSIPAAVLKLQVSFLPGLDDRDPDDPALIGSENVVSRNVAGSGCRAIFKGRVFTHDILDHELNIDSLQVIVRRHVTGVVTERKVERIKGRFDIGVI